MVWVLALVAIAAEPEVSVDGDHVVRGRMVVQAPKSVVDAVLDDPTRVAAIDDSGVQVTVKADEGRCKVVHTAIAHPLASAEYVSRACRTDDGWQHELVESRSIKAYEAEWTTEETDAGTEVTYAVKTETRLPVPQFVVDRQSRSAVARVLSRLRDHLERKLTRQPRAR